MLSDLASSFGYQTDGRAQRVVLKFGLSLPARPAAHPTALAGRLTVSRTGYVAGMVLDQPEVGSHGTFSAERLAVWSMDDEQLEELAAVARDALAIRRAVRGLRDN